jgi:hypothetical protein
MHMSDSISGWCETRLFHDGVMSVLSEYCGRYRAVDNGAISTMEGCTCADGGRARR